MGLDTSHGAYAGGYGGYSIMRAAIVRAAGWTFDDGDSYADRATFTSEPEFDMEKDPVCATAWRRAEMGDIDIDEWPWDPLIFLWGHQDCDGIIKPGMAAALAKRIEPLLPKIDEATRGWAEGWIEPQARSTTKLARKFVRGLKLAARHGEDVVYA